MWLDTISTLPADYLPHGWILTIIQGVQMIDAGEYGIMPPAEAYALRDMLATTSKRPGWAK